MINYYYIILSLILSMLLSDEKIEPQSSPYQGNWPYYPAKDSLKNIINIDNILCPNNLGCECVSNKDCNRKNDNKKTTTDVWLKNMSKAYTSICTHACKK